MSPNLKRVFLRTGAGLLGLMLILFAVAVVIGYSSARAGEEGASFDVEGTIFWVMAAFSVALMIGGFVVGIAWMRSIDEAAREAHKAAWFWGGSGGMAVCGVPIILASLPHAASWTLPVLWGGRTDPVAYAAAGAFALMLVMTAGYSLVWAGWWLARR